VILVMARSIDYELKYRHIYIKVSEFVLSAKSVAVYKDFAIPLVKKIIKNYDRFRINITNIEERRVCDDYIESMKRLVEIMQRKVIFYEKYQGMELDMT